MADNIKVNAGQWQSLSTDDRDRVTNILTMTGLLKQGSAITPDATAPQAAVIPAGGVVGGAAPQLFGINIPNPFCKAACDIAQAAAVAACTAGTAGIGLAVCLAAAQVAGDACRNSC